jgi:hypothetical protein
MSLWPFSPSQTIFLCALAYCWLALIVRGA